MTNLSRAELISLIPASDAPNRLTTKMINSSHNKVDDEWIGTQAEYDALGVYDDGVFYYIIEGA